MPVQVGWNREMDTRPFLQDAERDFFCDIGNFVPYITKHSAGCTRCAKEGCLQPAKITR